MPCLTPFLIGLSLYTYHFSGDLNNTTPGVYLQTECGLTLGAYRNSLRKDSLVLGYTWDIPSSPFSLTMGAVSGYNSSLSPFLLPTYSLPLGDKTSLRLGYVPKNPYKHSHDGVNFQITRSF